GLKPQHYRDVLETPPERGARSEDPVLPMTLYCANIEPKRYSSAEGRYQCLETGVEQLILRSRAAARWCITPVCSSVPAKESHGKASAGQSRKRKSTLGEDEHAFAHNQPACISMCRLRHYARGLDEHLLPAPRHSPQHAKPKHLHALQHSC